MTNVLDTTPLVDPHRLDGGSLDTLFTRAATAYTFAPTPVTDEELRAVWDLAKWPPTSSNFQPMRVLFVRSPAARAKLAESMNDNNREKTLAAPAVAVLAFDRQWHENIEITTPHLAHLKGFLSANREPRIDAARNNSWLQAGYFILAIRALGLAAGPMGGFQPEPIDKEFFPDGRWGTFLVVNIGHPAEGSYRARLPRLEQEQTVHFI